MWIHSYLLPSTNRYFVKFKYHWKYYYPLVTGWADRTTVLWMNQRRQHFINYNYVRFQKAGRSAEGVILNAYWKRKIGKDGRRKLAPALLPPWQLGTINGSFQKLILCHNITWQTRAEYGGKREEWLGLGLDSQWGRCIIDIHQIANCPARTPCSLENKHCTNVAQGSYWPFLVVCNFLSFLSSGRQERISMEESRNDGAYLKSTFWSG